MQREMSLSRMSGGDPKVKYGKKGEKKRGGTRKGVRRSEE